MKALTTSNFDFIRYFLMIFISFLFLFTSNIFAQSRYLENGIGGSNFQLNTSITTSGFNSIGISAAYSIGGIMDIGFELDRANGTYESYDSTEWNFVFLYNVIVLKQTDYIPVSLQLEGSYGYTNVSSDYLTSTDKTYEGQGFQIGGSLFREFNKKGLFSFLIGAKGSYKNYTYTEVDNALVTTNTERNEMFIWGGIGAVSLRPKRWPIFTIEVEVLYNQTESKLFIQPSFLIISPSY